MRKRAAPMGTPPSTAPRAACWYAVSMQWVSTINCDMIWPEVLIGAVDYLMCSFSRTTRCNRVHYSWSSRSLLTIRGKGRTILILPQVELSYSTSWRQESRSVHSSWRVQSRGWAFSIPSKLRRVAWRIDGTAWRRAFLFQKLRTCSEFWARYCKSLEALSSGYETNKQRDLLQIHRSLGNQLFNIVYDL